MKSLSEEMSATPAPGRMNYKGDFLAKVSEAFDVGSATYGDRYTLTKVGDIVEVLWEENGNPVKEEWTS